MRDTDLARRGEVLQKIAQSFEEVGARRKLRITSTTLNADAPARCAPAVVAALENACYAKNVGYKHMVSRAYHDSLFISRIAPTAMLFIPMQERRKSPA